ncbi:MAG: hypothetical protein JSW39_14240 [Desulfobacterales bacterium]|nr:MAG: hypothetical protein JSW39_14240 [Desulfobacterales bacterium]
MKATTILTLIFATFVLMVGGCEHIPSARQDTLLNRNFGRAFETAKHNQILNPNADKNLQPVEGLDGQLVEQNMETYRKGKEKQRDNVLTLGTSLR